MMIGRQCTGPVAATVLALALAACAPLARPALPSPVAGVAIRRTPLARYVEIIGRKRQHAPPFLGVAGTNFFVLRSWLDRRTGHASTELYVSDSHHGPERVWQSAFDSAGRALQVYPIRSARITCIGGCSWVEDFAAGIPARDLAPGTGFAVRFVARSGASLTIGVPAAAVEAQRAAIAAARRKLAILRLRNHSPGSTRFSVR